MTIVDDFFEEQKTKLKVENILTEVKILTGNATNDEMYNFYKNKIMHTGLTDNEYEIAIKRLCDILYY